MLSRLSPALSRVAVDIAPLRESPDFRRLWLGLLVSELGVQFTIVATFIQVYDLTGSTAATGTIGLVAFVGVVIGALAAGTFIDVTDRRTTLMLAQLAFVLASGTLFAVAIFDVRSVWPVFAAIAAIAGISAINSSVRNAITPRLVTPQQLPSALALNQVVGKITGLAGPALAGVLIAELGLAWAYGYDVVSYLVMLFVAWRIRPLPPGPTDERRGGLRAVLRGFAYIRERPVVQGAFAADVVAMMFGMPRALFPVLAVMQFERGPEVVGLMFAAPAVGALIGALFAGWVHGIRHQGRAVLWAVVLWGASIAAFGLAGSNLPLALAMLAVAGAADVISAILRGTIIQLSVPDAMRGRLSSINYLVVAGGPRLGDLEAGLVAAAFTPTVSVVSGGLLCIVGAGAVSMLWPKFREDVGSGSRDHAPEYRET